MDSFSIMFTLFLCWFFFSTQREKRNPEEPSDFDF
jgi:hypothetical protein